MLLLCAATACPLAASAAELTGAETSAPAVHHVRARCHCYPRVHYGYYWYAWGYRIGGTRHSWIGSRFAGADPWW